MSGLKPSQMSHIRYTDIIFLLQDWLNPEESISLHLENHTSFSRSGEQTGDCKHKLTLSPWLYNRHIVHVWLQFRWEQTARIGVGTVMGPQMLTKFISSSTTCSLCSLENSHLKCTGSNRLRKEPAGLPTSAEVLDYNWKVLTASINPKEQKEEQQTKPDQVILLQLKWCYGSLKFVSSLNLNKVAWKSYRAWSCWKPLHSDVEPNTVTFRASQRKALQGSAMQDKCIMAWKAGKPNRFPRPSPLSDPEKKRNGKNNLTLPTRLRRDTCRRQFSEWAAPLFKANWWWYF